MGSKTFDGMLEKDDEKNKPIVLKREFDIFTRAFRLLFAYNYFLHLAAALVSFGVRTLGRKVVTGAKPVQSQLFSVVKCVLFR
jgi:hypothetical protein